MGVMKKRPVSGRRAQLRKILTRLFLIVLLYVSLRILYFRYRKGKAESRTAHCYPSEIETDPDAAVTIITKTYERQSILKETLNNIRRIYPRLPAVVVDDSVDIDRDERFTYCVAPTSIGVCAGRNMALDAVATEYFVHIDDDIVFKYEIDFQEIIDTVMKPNGIDLVSFQFYKEPDRRQGCHNFSWDSDHNLHSTCVHLSVEDRYKVCEYPSQQFIARTSAIIKAGAWDPIFLATGDHEDFFLNLKEKGVKVAIDNLNSVYHQPPQKRYASIPYLIARKWYGFDDKNPHFYRKWNINERIKDKCKADPDPRVVGDHKGTL